MDLLHGYTDDVGYNPTNMEEDGIYLDQFSWSYEDVPPDNIQEDLYNYDGPCPCLHRNVSNNYLTCVNQDRDEDNDDSNSSDNDDRPLRKKKKSVVPRVYNVKTSHHLYVYVRKQYGLESISRSKQN